jgi:hypothetical protein
VIAWITSGFCGSLMPSPAHPARSTLLFRAKHSFVGALRMLTRRANAAYA